jgi:hypothetical protein
VTAGHLARSEYFPYTHARELDWEQRRELLIHEMQTLDSDIICCQVRRVRHVWVIERSIYCVLQELTHYESYFKVCCMHSYIVMLTTAHISYSHVQARLRGLGYDSVFLKRPKKTGAEYEHMHAHTCSHSG